MRLDPDIATGHISASHRVSMLVRIPLPACLCSAHFTRQSGHLMPPDPANSSIDTGFVNGVSITDLGPGSGIALWGIRACASGHGQCPGIRDGFGKVFGDRGPEMLADVLQITRVFGHKGRRVINIAPPGCTRLTSDELSMAAMFSAAQAGDASERDAHALWLLGRQPEYHVGLIAERIAENFLTYDLPMSNPPISLMQHASSAPQRPPAFYSLDGGTA